MIKLNLKFHNDVFNWRLEQTQEFISWLEEECSSEKMNGKFQIVFVNSDFITVLNKTYFNREHPTDVIAFDLSEDETFIAPVVMQDVQVQVLDGEVYVCLDKAREQAEEYSVSLTEEISRLALHGLLHLAGWRDNNESDRREMRIREELGLYRANSTTGEIPWIWTSPLSED